MPIEFQCSGCGNTLRVPDEHAGRQAKCPVCERISEVPLVSRPGDVPRGDDFDLGGGDLPRSGDVSLGADDVPVGGGGIPPLASDNPYESSQTYSSSLLQPHRGGLILTLGILSVLCCNLLGIAAWIMGNEDLNKMERGQMDPSGRGLTQAGKVLGIIAIVLMVLAIVIQGVLFVVGVN